MIHRNIRKLCTACLLTYLLIFIFGILLSNTVFAGEIDREYFQKDKLSSEFGNQGYWDDLINGGLGFIITSIFNGGDNFGKSIALSHHNLVIGSPFENSVYLYQKIDNDWSFIEKIMPSQEMECYGLDTALVNNTLAVSGCGYVYLYEFSNGNWQERALIKPDNVEADDSFGLSIAIEQNNENIILVVGAPYNDSASIENDVDNLLEESGAVYVFKINDNNVELLNYLKSSNRKPKENFGYSVAISKVIREQMLIVVGAPDDSNRRQGSAYAYFETSSNSPDFSFMEDLTINENCKNYGKSVSVSVALIAVGCPSENQGGAVYTFAIEQFFFQSATILIEYDTKIQPSNLESNDEFGGSIDLSGNKLIVGSPLEDSISSGVNGDELDNSGNNTGAVYVFSRKWIEDEFVWQQQNYLKSSHPTQGMHEFGNPSDFTSDLFGSDVAISGSEIIVGAYQENLGAGSVYVYSNESQGISSNHTGLWYDKNETAHALSYYLLNDNRVVALWATFDNEGHQQWLVGVGTHDGNTATLGVHKRKAGSFPPNGDESYAQSWGVFKINFINCNAASFTWTPLPERNFTSGSTKLSRLTNTNGLGCTKAKEKVDNLDTFSMKDSNSALWSNSSGDFLTNTFMLANNRILHMWYTFDNNNQPIWLQGIGTHDGVTATMDAYIFSGGNFPPNYNHDDVNIDLWGQFELEFADCNNGLFKWMPNDTSQYSTGEIDLHRLTNTKGLNCED